MRILLSISNRHIFSLIAVTSLAAVGFALSTQHLLGMHPCIWCVFQRLVCFVIAGMALIGALSANRHAQTVSGLLVTLTSAIGIAAAIAQHRAVLEQDSCALSVADKVISGLGLDVAIPFVFEPEATCVEAAATLLGVPYEFWTLLLFSGLAIVAVYSVLRNYLGHRETYALGSKS